MEIPHEAFAARRSVCAVTQVDHVTHLGGIYLPNWQTKPRKRAEKTAGTEYFDLDLRGLTFVPLDCAAWMLQREVGAPLNVFGASKSLSPLLTGQDPPFEEALNWLQFAYTADRAGDYVAPVSMVLAQSTIA